MGDGLCYSILHGEAGEAVLGDAAGRMAISLRNSIHSFRRAREGAIMVVLDAMEIMRPSSLVPLHAMQRSAGAARERREEGGGWMRDCGEMGNGKCACALALGQLGREGCMVHAAVAATAGPVSSVIHAFGESFQALLPRLLPKPQQPLRGDKSVRPCPNRMLSQHQSQALA